KIAEGPLAPYFVEFGRSRNQHQVARAGLQLRGKRQRLGPIVFQDHAQHVAWEIERIDGIGADTAVDYRYPRCDRIAIAYQQIQRSRAVRHQQIGRVLGKLLAKEADQPLLMRLSGKAPKIEKVEVELVIDTRAFLQPLPEGVQRRCASWLPRR